MGEACNSGRSDKAGIIETSCFLPADSIRGCSPGIFCNDNIAIPIRNKLNNKKIMTKIIKKLSNKYSKKIYS